MEAHLLYLNEDGSYELEGSLDSITLPKNLNQSIRLRLATVGETDPTLALLLSVMAVLGGSFTLPVATSMWRVLVPDGDITASIAKALKHKFVKFLSASGAQRAAGTGSRRRSSAAGDAQNRWAFHHRALSPPPDPYLHYYAYVLALFLGFGLRTSVLYANSTTSI